MDTRNKILTTEAVRRLPRPLSAATGLFDILREEPLRELERLRSAGGPVLAIVLSDPASTLELQARAEMAAALRAVDYVVIATPEEAESLLDAIEPAAVARLEGGDRRRADELKLHIDERCAPAVSGTKNAATGTRILVVRLGAMGDIIHALPAVAALKQSFPGARLTWLVEAKWAELLERNPYIDRLVLLQRGSASGLLASLRELRSETYDFAVDFQGLLKSAIAAYLAGPDQIFGFEASQVRERAAAVFYSHRVATRAAHVVDRNIELARAAGAVKATTVFPLPPGEPEGALPDGPFVLASPLAGWRSKQWPREHYAALAAALRSQLGVPLVLNGAPAAERELKSVEGAWIHISGLGGLIYATRRAAAVVGVDSGPLHIAAALERPGVAIFGPTDPARNGPYGGSLRVIRSASAETSYKRLTEVDESMRQISPDLVFEELRSALALADTRYPEQTA